MNEAYQYQSSLLIDEPPMLMLPSLAKALKSADKAIMVQQIHYWLQIKRKHTILTRLEKQHKK